jgi:hypothetical protein
LSNPHLCTDSSVHSSEDSNDRKNEATLNDEEGELKMRIKAKKGDKVIISHDLYLHVDPLPADIPFITKGSVCTVELVNPDFFEDTEMFVLVNFERELFWIRENEYEVMNVEI